MFLWFMDTQIDIRALLFRYDDKDPIMSYRIELEKLLRRWRWCSPCRTGCRSIDLPQMCTDPRDTWYMSRCFHDIPLHKLHGLDRNEALDELEKHVFGS